MAVITMIGKKKNKVEAGFTLTELLIVVLILGLIVGIVGPTLYKKIAPAKQATARAQIKNFMSGLDSFFIDVGRYPSSDEGLSALRESNGIRKWDGPYLKQELPKDPWDNPYIYVYPGQNGPYDIVSYGADGKQGGEDENRDITSWESH